MAPANLLSFQDSSMVDMDLDLSWEFASSPQGKIHRRFSREVWESQPCNSNESRGFAHNYRKYRLLQGL